MNAKHMMDTYEADIARLRAELDKQTVKLANKTASIDGLLEKWRDAEKESGELRAELAAECNRANEFQKAEKELSDAYLRLRDILRALDTSHAPTPEEVWAHTETKAQKVMKVLEAADEETRQEELPQNFTMNGRGQYETDLRRAANARRKAVREWREGQ